MKFHFQHPYGFCELAASIEECRIKSEAGRVSDEKKLREIQEGDTVRWEEFRSCGPDGAGWYFAGKAIIEQ